MAYIHYYYIIQSIFTALIILGALSIQASNSQCWQSRIYNKRRLYRWRSSDGPYRNQIKYIVCSRRWRSSIQSAKTRPGADCGSDHELLIAKFRLKLNKVGKSTRPFRYDLNQVMSVLCLECPVVSTLCDPLDYSPSGACVHGIS